MNIEELKLEGITGAEGDRSALIGGKIYNEKQKIGDYVVTEILKDKVILKNPETYKKATLNLFEEEELREQQGETLKKTEKPNHNFTGGGK